MRLFVRLFSRRRLVTKSDRPSSWAAAEKSEPQLMVFVASTLPALSVVRYSSVCGPNDAMKNVPEYVVHAPPSRR